MTGEPFRLGTRGSMLALRQANLVADRLSSYRYDVEIVEVETTGDRIDDELIHRLGTTGAFVRDLDERVLAGDLDGAVHSLKDMPTETPEELIVAAVPDRKPAHDVLVTPTGATLDELPPGAVVGTGSLRRQAQIAHARSDLDLVGIRGNVDTRVEKLLATHLTRKRDSIDDEDEREDWEARLTDREHAALDRAVETAYDALVMAEAGLRRTKLTADIEMKRLPIEQFVPAAGQGALALTTLDTERAERIHRLLDHPPTRVAVTVERTILKTLGGGCIAPIGVHAVVQGEVVKTRVQVLSQDGETVIETSRELPVEQYVESATRLAEELAEQGARSLIDEAHRDPAEEPGPA